MIELIILKYLLNNINYNKYRLYIKIKDNKELEALYNILDRMHGSYERDLTLEEFKATVLTDDPKLMFLIEQLEKVEFGEEVLKDLVQKVVERSWAHDHAVLAIEVTSGKKSLLDLMEHMSAIEDKTQVEEIEFVSDDAEDIYGEKQRGGGGINWRLPTLADAIGGLRVGDFGFVFARPETGKTSFLADQVTHFATQVDAPILWFNNEERSEKVKSRLHCAALELTKEEIKEDTDGHVAEYMKVTKGNIKLIDQEAEKLHKKYVERVIKEIKPSLVVIDQLDKIVGFSKEDREDLRLGAAYIWARHLAKTYCPVIGVCQADATGEGKQYLTMDNVANAKTAKQAEADYIIGIGCSHKLGMEHIRWINLSKNKLTGKHSKIETIFDAPTARYKDI